MTLKLIQLFLAILLFISAMLGMLIYNTINTTNDFSQQLNTLEQINTNQNRMILLQRDLTNLQRLVLLYKETGSTATLQSIQELETQIQAYLDELEHNLIAPEALQRISRMRESLKLYHENFDAVISEKEKLSNWMKQLESIDITQEPQLIALYKYLLHQDPIYLKLIQQHPFNNPQLQYIKSRRIVNEMRLFNHLVNVVMAGEANEILYQSTQLKEYSYGALKKSQLSIEQQVAYQQHHAIVMSAIAISVCTLLFWLLQKMIMAPVIRLSAAFTRIAEGQQPEPSNAQSPISELAELEHSTVLFTQKNAQVLSLLRHTQQLSEQQQQLNQELAEKKLAAEQALQTKNAFVANISHEIRTPLNGIKGFVELALKSDQIPPKIAHYLRQASYSGDILARIINQLLDYSKLDAGKLKLTEAPFALIESIKSISEIVAVNIQNKAVNLYLATTPQVPDLIIHDQLRFSQCLMNLCNNAVKFTERGHVLISLDFQRASKQHGILSVKVQDTGIGIAPEYQPKIFDKFIQEDHALTRQYEGTGLGLAIVKHLVELMGGQINFNSQKNVGSCFYFQIPIHVPTEQSAPRNVHHNVILIGKATQISTQIVEGYLAQLHFIEDYHYCQLEACIEGMQLNSDDQLIVDLASVSPDESQMALLQQYAAQCQVSYIHPFPRNTHTPDTTQTLTHPFSYHDFEDFISTSGKRALTSDNAPSASANPEPLSLAPTKAHNNIILVVEDNPINLELICEILKSLGYQIDIARDGKAALHKLSQPKLPYLCVLMDIQMPIMDGITAVRQARQRGYKGEIIGLSANVNEKDIHASLEAGMNDYLTKPIELAKLQQKLSELTR